MKNLIIICAGGHARETAFVAQDAGYTVLGFLDDNPDKHGEIISGFKCLGGIEEAKKFSDFCLTIAVGNPRARKKLYNRLSHIGPFNFATIIHPTVVKLSKNFQIGEGSVIFPNVYVSDNVSVGCHSIINVSATVSHDSTIGDFVTVNPRSTICGDCHIADGAEIGAGSTCIQGVSIDKNTFVGAGAVVIKSVGSNALYVGVPAEFKKTLEV